MRRHFFVMFVGGVSTLMILKNENMVTIRLVKVLSIMFVLLFLSSCGGNKKQCNENMVFKDKFFQSLQDIEEVIYGRSHDRKKYDDGLSFLNKYVDVDYSKTLNYRNIYTFKGFNDDKIEWLKWYEAHKCENISSQ